MSIEDYYEDDIYIKESTVTKSGIGSTVDSWTTLATIRGRIRPLSGKEIQRNDRNEVIADYRLYCDITTISEENRIEFENITYMIIYIQNPMEMDKFLQIDLKRIF